MSETILSHAKLPEHAAWGVRDMIYASLLSLGFFILGILTIALISAAIVAAAFFGADDAAASTMPAILIWGVFGLEAVIVVPAYVFGPRKYGGGFKALGLVAPRWLRSIALAAAAIVCILGINLVWEPIRQWIDIPGQPEMLPLFGEGIGGLGLALLLGAVVAPLAEEIFYRGFLYAGLRTRYGLAAGLIASSAIFSLVHLTPGVLVPIFGMGLVLAALYEYTGSLWSCIAVHSAINAMAFIGQYIVENYPQLLSGG